jgi:DNA polymerase-3 subunit delta
MVKTSSATIENFNRIMHDLQSGIYKPIYVLMGEEAYFIDQITNYIAQNILSAAEQEFNLFTLYGNESAGEIATAAQRYPMMCDHQIIIIKDAYKYVTSKIADNEDGESNNANQNPFEVYAQNPSPTTILVLCIKGKSIDKRTAFYKGLQKAGEVFESEQFKGYEQPLRDWIADYVRSKGCSIDRNAVELIISAMGVDLTKIVSEFDRLQMMLPQNTAQITSEHVEMLGVSKDFNSFELCNALMQKDAVKAHRIINYFCKTPKSFALPETLGAIFGQFSKLFGYHMLCKKFGSHNKIPLADLQLIMGSMPAFIIQKEYAPAAAKFSPHKTAEILSAIRSCDMRSKGWDGTAIDSGNLLKELACGILL